MSDETNAAVVETDTQPEGNAVETEVKEAPLETVALADIDDQADAADEHDESEDQTKLSRSQRRSAKIRSLSEQNESLRAEIERLRQWAPTESKDDLKAPKEDDFPNDWLGYQDAVTQYKMRVAIREEKQADIKAVREFAEQEAHRERIEAYNDRLGEFKVKLPDFDRVMSEARESFVRDDVRDSIMESEKGPLLAYYLAKNPDALDRLNRMSPLAAAREVGKIEARLYIPKPKTVSKAPAPSETPKGGASPAKDPSSMSMDEYARWRDGGGG